MSLSFRTVLPGTTAMAALSALPACAGKFCPRPPTLWQRWWSRHEGIRLHGRWYCSTGCFQAALYERLAGLALAPPRALPRPNRLPLGLILLSQGHITSEQLRIALERQRKAGGGRIGDWLVRMEAASEEQVTAALAAQQGCPVFAIQEAQCVPETLYWPELLADEYRAAPVFHNSARATLYVGFLERVHHPFLLSLEQMLHCSTEPCILPASVYRRQLELRRFAVRGETVAIQQWQDASEMTQTIANYAQQIHAERCGVARCNDRIWIRLEASGGLPVDFVFRQPRLP